MTQHYFSAAGGASGRSRLSNNIARNNSSEKSPPFCSLPAGAGASKQTNCTTTAGMRTCAHVDHSPLYLSKYERKSGERRQKRGGVVSVARGRRQALPLWRTFQWSSFHRPRGSSPGLIALDVLARSRRTRSGRQSDETASRGNSTLGLLDQLTG